MAGYLTITNDGPDDVLVAATSSIAKRAVVHLMSITNGVMKMGDVGAGIAIPHGQTVELKPMSSHIMFMGLTSEPAKGTSFDGTLTFAKAGSLKVSFKVLGTGQRP
jgi:copper(I)-binding protein